ncbi:hypothetical protein, partial [Xanthomonas campestris]|uniref:hypothetical protein n=1 Tax=Xanthomonas campestris TaxID=339 RepID=UPI0032E3F9C6
MQLKTAARNPSVRCNQKQPLRDRRMVRARVCQLVSVDVAEQVLRTYRQRGGITKALEIATRVGARLRAMGRHRERLIARK